MIKHWVRTVSSDLKDAPHSDEEDVLVRCFKSIISEPYSNREGQVVEALFTAEERKA